MNRDSFKSRFFGAAIFLAAIAVFAVAFMFLWNALMPQIFALPELNYWQALGLIILARILFGGFGGFGGFGARGAFHPWRHPQANALREKWMNMSDEERKAFIEKERAFHRHFSHNGERDDAGSGTF